MEIRNIKDYNKALIILDELSYNIKEEWAYLYCKKLKIRIREFEKIEMQLT